MGDKSRDVDRISHVTHDMGEPRLDDPAFLHAEARRMAKYLIKSSVHDDDCFTHVGAAIRDAALQHQVDASILQQAWNRPARDWKVSRWMALFAAYHRAKAKAGRAYASKRHEAETAGVHPALLRLADFVSGNAGDEDGANDQADRTRQ